MVTVSLDGAVDRFYLGLRHRVGQIQFSSYLGDGRHSEQLDVLSDVVLRGLLLQRSYEGRIPLDHASSLPFLTGVLMNHRYASEIGPSCIPAAKLTPVMRRDYLSIIDLAAEVVTSEGQDLEIDLTENKVLRINDGLARSWTINAAVETFELLKGICKRNEITILNVELDGGKADRDWLIGGNSTLLENGTIIKKPDLVFPTFDVNILKMNNFGNLPPSVRIELKSLVINQLIEDVNRAFMGSNLQSPIDEESAIASGEILKFALATISKDYIKCFIDDLKQAGYKGLPELN